MRVSKSFKRHVELMHIDIYNVSLGLCTKRYWFNKTWPFFDFLVRNLERFTNVDDFDRNELCIIHAEGTLFQTFLHFFLCKRACDGVEEYCTVCSHVRLRNFQNQTLFDDVILPERDYISKLGLDDRTVDFDVFLPIFQQYTYLKNVCRRERVIKHAADVFVLFVSTFVRINLNCYYKFFLSRPLTLNDEKCFIRQIQHCVRDYSNEIWHLNINYFFVIFD